MSRNPANRDADARTDPPRRFDARRLATFAGFNLLAWSGIAFLFAIQASSRLGWSQPFSRSLLNSLLEFAPYAILTPMVARIASKFHFTPESRNASTIAHSASAMWFVLITGLLMGAVDWFAGQFEGTLM